MEAEAALRPLQPMDLVGPALGALVFVLVLSAVPEPARRRFNAIFVAGAGSAYLTGGLGAWEFAYIAVATAAAYRGLRSYRFIGIAWLMHTGWDLVHHVYGNPIWPWQPFSSLGCAILDAGIAIWFLAGAPSVYGISRRGSACPGEGREGDAAPARRAPDAHAKPRAFG